MEENLPYLLLGIVAGRIIQSLEKWIHELYIRYRLKGGHFVGFQWQINFFNDSLFNLSQIDNTQRNKVQGIILSSGIKGWTEKDLSKYYHKNMIHLFYNNIDCFIHDSCLTDGDIYKHNRRLYYKYYYHNKNMDIERIFEIISAECYPDDMIRYLKEYSDGNVWVSRCEGCANNSSQKRPT